MFGGQTTEVGGLLTATPRGLATLFVFKHYFIFQLTYVYRGFLSLQT